MDISKLYVNLFVLPNILRLRESQVKQNIFISMSWKRVREDYRFTWKVQVPLRDLMLFEKI